MRSICGMSCLFSGPIGWTGIFQLFHISDLWPGHAACDNFSLTKKLRSPAHKQALNWSEVRFFERITRTSLNKVKVHVVKQDFTRLLPYVSP